MSADPVVIRSIPRTPTDVLDQLAGMGTATIHEASGRQGFVGPHIRPIQTGVGIAGNAVTVLSHPGDNMMIHAAVEVCGDGDVLVVVNTAPSSHGMFGELLATSLQHRGVRGLVIDAGVRDTRELRSMGFPVWSQYVSCQGTVKETPGSVNVPVAMGGTIIHPGDVVCADDDGVVVIAHRDATSCLDRSRKRLEKESSTRERLAAGELGVDMYGLRDKLEELGVTYLDSVDDLA
jgi:4-hydroxy-4-methyl-2-oxoglutarate aldolase